MRIVHVIDHFQPWMGYQETYLAREQVKQGHDVTVVTSNRLGTVVGGSARSRTVPAGRQPFENIDVIRLPIAFELPTGAAYVWMRGLERKLTELKPDAVHCHGVLGFTPVRVARMKDRLGFQLLYDNHMADFNVYAPGESSVKSRIKQGVYPALGLTSSPWVVRKADSIVAIGEPERSFVQRLFGRRCPEVPIVRLGADTSNFDFRPEGRAMLRQHFGWTERDVVLGHAGTIRRSKAMDVLIRAAGELVRDGLPVQVLIVGRIDPEHRHELLDLMAETGIQQRVHFQEFVSVEDLPDYLSAMDVAVWPGDISNTAIEAMAVGLPVVAARTPYTESIVERPGAGPLFRLGSVQELTGVLKPLVGDPDYRSTLSRHARHAIENELNWASIARQFVDLYANERQPARGSRQIRAAS